MILSAMERGFPTGGPRRFLLLLVCAVFFASPSLAASELQARLLPALDGYPAGKTTPLIFMLQLPPGTELNKKPTQRPRMVLQGVPGLKADVLRLSPVKMGRGPWLVVVAGLAVEPQTKPGRIQLQAELTLPLAQAGELPVRFALPVEILPQGEQATVSSPQMLRRFGVEPPPGARAPKASPAARGMLPRPRAVPAPKPQSGPPALAGSQPPEAPPRVQYLSGVYTWLDDLWQKIQDGGSFWFTLGVVFLAGLLLNLTPCIYPLVPVTVSFFGGRAGYHRSALLAHVLLYWLGLALMYAVLGVTAALTGGILGQALTHPAVLAGIGIIFLALAAAMFGLWEFRLPSALNSLAGAERSGLAGTFVMGLTLGVLAAPCVGPFVIGLLAHVALRGETIYGLAVFLALAAGLGLPLAVLAFFSGSLTRLPGAGDWMVWVRRFFGLVLVLMALIVLRPLTGDEFFRWAALIIGLAGGVYLAFFEKSGAQGGFKWVKLGLGLAAALFAAVFFWVSAPPPQEARIPWQDFSEQSLQEAKAAGKPIMVYVTASWCPPCRQMKFHTWPDAGVIRALRKFTPLKMDVSAGVPSWIKPYQNKWRFRGVPTIVFLNPEGKALIEHNITGFVPPDILVDRLALVHQQAKGR